MNEGQKGFSAQKDPDSVVTLSINNRPNLFIVDEYDCNEIIISGTVATNVYMPPASSLPIGRKYIIHNTTNGAIYIYPAASSNPIAQLFAGCTTTLLLKSNIEL